ncbi:MAG: DUF2949 domain-containing protein [Thermostichus sp. HHBFW_bins_43]
MWPQNASNLSSHSERNSLEEHLLELGWVDEVQLELAKKLQDRMYGPLSMVLLQLGFLTLEQLEVLFSNQYSLFQQYLL